MYSQETLVTDPLQALEAEEGVFEVTAPTGVHFRVASRPGHPPAVNHLGYVPLEVGYKLP